MKHALVVGGTGMLADVSLWLVSQGYHVSVIGRSSSRMANVLNQAIDPLNITPIIVNYDNDLELKDKLENSVKKNGPIKLVVAWIHSYAENALQIISQVATKNENQWKLFHILGSSKNLTDIKKAANVPDSCQYHQVQLGFILEKNNSRWLTNKEISVGVIDSILKEKPIYTVGVLEPWNKRP